MPGSDDVIDQLRGAIPSARPGGNAEDASGRPQAASKADAIQVAIDAGPSGTVDPPQGQAPTSTSTDSAEIARLAKLPRLEYDRTRKKAAKRLGVLVAALDAEVKAARGSTAPTRVAPIEVEKVEPWSEPVDGPQLLNALAESVRRFVVLPKYTDTAVALWVLHTYLIDAASTTPLLALRSPEKRCGKTTLLAWLKRMVNRPLLTSNVSPAAVFRLIEQDCPTLLIDEADTFLRDNEELRGVLNSGHTRDAAYVLRCVGDSFEPKRFSTWCPKVLAMIGGLSDTLEDRSITVKMRRRLPREKAEKLRHASQDHFERLRSRCIRFAADQAKAVRLARPSIPECMNDRAADNWEPLLAIADAAGGDWPTRARTAAIALSEVERELGSIGVQLLADIKRLFESKGVHRMSGADLVEALCQDPEGPWATLYRGMPITQNWLSGRLKEFSIVSKSVRIVDKTPKGYKIEDFAEAFERYLPQSSAQPTLEAQQRHIPTGTGDSGDFRSATEASVLQIEKAPKAAPDKACGVVADRDPVTVDG